MITIGNRNIRVQAQEWKGKWYVHIRQWYGDPEDLKPGKGIGLTLEEWNEFVEKFDTIKEMVEEETDE